MNFILRMTMMVGLSVLSLCGTGAAAKTSKARNPAAAAAKQTAEQRAERLNGRAIVRSTGGDYKAAEKLLREALKIAPRFGDSYVNLSGILLEQDRTVEAEKVSRIGLKLPPQIWSTPILHYNLGQALLLTGRFKEAADEYRAALMFEEDDEEARLGLLNALFNRGLKLTGENRWPEAEGVWREALNWDKQNVEIQFQLASALFRQKKYADAEPLYRKCVKANPKEGIYAFSLSGVLAITSREPEAEAILRKLLGQKWNEFAVRRSLAALLMMMDKMPAAEAEMATLIKLEPTNASNYAQLAECQFKQNRLDEARASVKKARELGLTKNTELDELEKKLASPAAEADKTPAAVNSAP